MVMVEEMNGAFYEIAVALQRSLLVVWSRHLAHFLEQ